MLSEHSERSAEHYDQDQERQQQRLLQNNPNFDSSDSSSSSSSSDSEDDGNPPSPSLPPPPPPPPPPAHYIPPGGRPYQEPVQIHFLNPMNVQCPNCHALHFISEKLANSGVRNPCIGMCCLQGQVTLPPIQQWPRALQDLFDEPHDQTEFRKKICQYNNALAFTSVGADLENDAVQGAGPNAFCVHGALHHLMGALIPPDGLQPAFAQLYIYDPEEATDR